jgi:hypothetical protein
MSNDSMINKLINPINLSQIQKKDRVQRLALNERLSSKINIHNNINEMIKLQNIKVNKNNVYKLDREYQYHNVSAD